MLVHVEHNPLLLTVDCYHITFRWQNAGRVILGFLTGRDSATFRDKGTEVSLLSWDKGTTGQVKILPRDGTGRDSLSKSGTGRGTGQSLFFCQNPGRDEGQEEQTLFFSSDILL